MSCDITKIRGNEPRLDSATSDLGSAARLLSLSPATRRPRSPRCFCHDWHQQWQHAASLSLYFPDTKPSRLPPDEPTLRPQVGS